MDADGWVRRLESGRVLRLTTAEQREVVSLADAVDVPRTGLSAGPVLLRIRGRVACLERAAPDTWALRPLAGEDEAQAFLERRREQLDRMWDGCGCRIDPFE